jgi:acetoin utilization deacetylase AcuC-like enzyme
LIGVNGTTDDSRCSEARNTGLIWHELLMWHDTSPLAGFLKSGHGILEPAEPAESPASKRRIKNLLDVSGLTQKLDLIEFGQAADEELLRVHTFDYIAALKSMSGKDGGDASLGFPGGETPFGPGGFEIAALAAGGVLQAADSIVSGRVRNAYALLRPPGHHAESDHGFGFCIFNHGALAARHAQSQHRLGKIAIVDWDAHHGNGAEHIFWDDPSVLTISIHQDGAYPAGSGSMASNGGGRGEGYNINIPLPPGSGTGAYAAAMEAVVAPALLKFRPDLIVVACGFDAGAYDPMARMMLHSKAFGAMTEAVMEVAGACCGGRLLMIHEGGYHLPSVPFHGLAVLEQLSGICTGMADPFLPLIEGLASQSLQPHQETVIRDARRLLSRIG